MAEHIRRVFNAELRVLHTHTHNSRFTALCPGLPGWAGTIRNTHPPTILIIIQSLLNMLKVLKCLVLYCT